MSGERKDPFRIEDDDLAAILDRVQGGNNNSNRKKASVTPVKRVPPRREQCRKAS